MILDLDCVDIYEQCNGMGHFIEKIKPYRKSGFLIRYGVTCPAVPPPMRTMVGKNASCARFENDKKI